MMTDLGNPSALKCVLDTHLTLMYLIACDGTHRWPMPACCMRVIVATSYWNGGAASRLWLDSHSASSFTCTYFSPSKQPKNMNRHARVTGGKQHDLMILYYPPPSPPIHPPGPSFPAHAQVHP